jgi:hypothetical protein
LGRKDLTNHTRIRLQPRREQIAGDTEYKSRDTGDDHRDGLAP